MLYRIGIVAELFGLTGETLRNYEKAGLIESSREEKGGSYRHYDINTISKLVGIRALRTEGFSIDELQQLYNDTSLEEVHGLVQQKIGEKERELRLSQALLELMQEQEECLCRIRSGDIMRLCTNPAMYLLPYRNNEFLHIDGVEMSRLTQWAQNLFLVQSFMRYSEEFTPIRGEEYNAAFAVFEELAPLLGMDLSEPVRYLPAGQCLCCLCRRMDGEEPFAHIKPRLEQYLGEHSLKMRAEPFSLTVFSFHTKEGKQSWMKLYVPVSPVNSTIPQG